MPDASLLPDQEVPVQAANAEAAKVLAPRCATGPHRVFGWSAGGHTQVTAQARLQRKTWSRSGAFLRCKRVFDTA